MKRPTATTVMAMNVSILYLRCRDMYIDDAPTREFVEVSILYLRCCIEVYSEHTVTLLIVSILYLRCDEGDDWAPSRLVELDVVSILYLRCRPHDVSSGRHPGPCCSFNSLFEMHREAVAEALKAAENVSILYLRCNNAEGRGLPQRSR